MKPITRKQRQWLWFISLWCGGLGSVFVLAYLIRWVMGLN